jgi:SAM-dependent methyltransferase
VGGRGGYFDDVADLYDRARPGYPRALVDEVMRFARLDAGDRVLEIGCGTGQASVSFAARGLRMVCLEPGPNLAGHALRRLAPFPGAEVRCETFERWRLDREAFGLVLCGRSLHWVRPRVRYAKTARALRPGGALAIFQNDMLDGDAPVDAAVRELVGSVASGWGPRERELRDSGRFERIESRTFEWTRAYQAADYADLLRTRSRFRDSPLLARVPETVLAHGGHIDVRYTTRLLLARRATDLSWWHRLTRRARQQGRPPSAPAPPAP